MISDIHRNAGGLPLKIKSAMTILIESHAYALDLERDLWDFPVEIETLQEIGLTPNDFRWLVSKGYVEVGCELTKPCSEHREFSLCRSHAFNDRSCHRRACFILTDAGLAYAREALGESIDEVSTVDDRQVVETSTLLPEWKPDVRELRCNGSLIKRFRCRAPNQESILAVFEEEGWPTVIDDPLTGIGENQDPHRRLNDAVRGLNRYQTTSMIHFSSDGTGEGVRWEWTKEV
mgnify:CR=1 FL=1|jgi:hypothetical protein